MITIREEVWTDVAAREQLLDTCFGPQRHLKTCERLREGRVPADGLALAAEHDGALAGTVRLWNVRAGPDRAALMLGPLAVDPSLQGLGLGGKLLQDAVLRAQERGHGAILLVGDAPYYERFGFSAQPTAGLAMPGPFERERFLGLELVPGALSGARGRVEAAGRLAVRTVRPVRAAAEACPQSLAA